MNRDTRQAVMVCLLVFLALGFAGWYENYVPEPTIDPDKVYTAEAEHGR